MTFDVKHEQWRIVPDHPGYEVSDLGRIRSLTRVTDRGRRWRGRTMTQTQTRNGYMTVSLWRDGKRSIRLVHRLVLSAFAGPPPHGCEALHSNGNPADNSLANLRWGARSENILDQVIHGTHGNASKDKCAKGHPYTEANTYHYPNRKHRACRECRREWLRKSREKKAA